MQTRGILLNVVMNRLDWEHHGKSAALAWCAFDRYRSSQQRCQLAYDGKTESRPSSFPRVRPVSLVKGFENMFLNICRDANPAIFHGKRHALNLLVWGDHSSSRNRHLTLFRELQCIGNQVEQHLA